MLNHKWKALYDGASRSNDVLRAINAATDMTDDEKTVAAAQTRALRGHYYLELKKLWNMIPFVDENALETRLPNDKDIWPDIENDFKYAAENLPETFAEIGRINKWAAKAYLAKVYMYQRKYSDAKPILDDIIANGVTTKGDKYGLMDCVREVFDMAFENNKECVFSCQMSVKDGVSGGYNGTWFWILNNQDCCHFFRPSINLGNAYRTGADGLPLLDTYNNFPLKNDLGLASSQPFTPETGTLDPRLDWTMGRRGIPFLDYGVHPGKNWRDGNFEDGGPYIGEKYTTTNAQKNDIKIDTWGAGVSPMNYIFIRFADVLLWAAECEVEVGSPEKAREYVNMIRNRAKNGCVVQAPGGGPAANYLINPYLGPWADKDFARKAVRFERRLELALEGHRFFDLVRWQIAEPYLNEYVSKEKIFRPLVATATFQQNDEYLPLPESEIINSYINGVPTLTQNP
jgi:hypothetical protein